MNGLVAEPAPPGGSIVTLPSGATFQPSDISRDQPLPLPNNSSHPAVLPNSIPGEQIAAMPKDIGGQSNPIKDAWRDEWLAAGYPPAAVEGASRRVGVESGWNVYATGDYDEYGNPTSIGLTQHHGERAVKFANYLKNNKVDMNDPVAIARADAKFSISEFNGGDAIAAKHKAELMNPNISEQEGYGVFTSSFERPAGSPGSEETNLRSNALGSFNAGASAYLQTWQQDIQKRSKEYDDALAEGKDLRKVARAAMAKWELSSEHPPQDMRENWNQWAGAAIGLAMLGGFFGKNHTAAINAAGEMLQAANQADVRAYDIAYKRWKDHNDNGLKLIELLHGEARDIVEDARKSYDQKVTELGTLSTAYQLQQHLDPKSVENIEKSLRVQQLTTQITEAQHDNAKKAREEKEIAASVEQKDKELEQKEGRPVTPAEHLQHEGEAKRQAAGTFSKPSAAKNIDIVGPDGKVTRTNVAAYQSSDGSWFMAGTNEPLEVPPGGSVRLRGTSQPRSAPAIAMQKFMEEHPEAGFEAVAMAAARIRALGAMEQAFGSGAQGNTIRSLNVAIDHTDVLQQLADALQNKDTPKLNALKNRVLVEFGYEGPVDFDVAKKIVADELVKAVLGNNAGTGAERLELQADFDRSSSPEQLKGVIQTARRLMLGQMRGLEFQYAGQDEKRQGTFREKLFDHTKEALETTDKAGKGGGGPTEALPPGIPAGSKKIGTYQGKDVYQAPDGSKWQP
jgi:hypothetical protein